MQLERAVALAPGGVGNIGPGLDVLGMAVTGLGDRVTAERSGEPGVVMADGGHPDLPRETKRNAAGIAALAVLERAGARDVGVRLTLEKRLPLSGGQGGSAGAARSTPSRYSSARSSPNPGSRDGMATTSLPRCSAA